MAGPGPGTPFKDPPPTSVLDTLPDWWGVLTGGMNSGRVIRFQPPPDPTDPQRLLPVPYGEVRVDGTLIDIEGLSYDTPRDGQGVIAWSEGEIESIDKVYGNGGRWVSRSDYSVDVVLNEHLGETGGETNPGGIFGGAQPTFANASYTHWTINTSPYYFFRWWNYIPGGFTADGFPLNYLATKWTADIHGLKLYDPRSALTVYSNNPALIVRDLLKRFGKLPDALLDDVSIGAAADACDAIGFTCSVVFTTKTTLRDALAVVLQTCNGKLITANGKTGLYMDVLYEGEPAATLSEEDGDVWSLKYDWISARDRYTRVAVSFRNKDADYKQDVTPDFDDPGILAGSVPIRAVVIDAPGINTLDAAVILRDYLFNSAAITFRLSGTMNAKGLSLQEGQKIRITTLKEEDGDFLLEQIVGDDKGFFSFVAKPYDSDVYGTTPISQPPPIVPPGPPGPAATPNDITVTGSSGTLDVMRSTSSNTQVYDLYQLIQYTLPSAGPMNEIRVRGFRGTGAATKTWDDMVDSEIPVPLAGNSPPIDATHFVLSHNGIVKTIKTLTFDPFGRLKNTTTATGPTRLIIKVATVSNVLSTGVTIDVAEDNDSVDETLTPADIGRGFMIAYAPAPTGGPTTIEGILGGANWVLPKPPSSSRILLFPDGQLVRGGEDYWRNGQNVFFPASANKPQIFLSAAYPYGEPDDGGGNPEGHPPGTAHTWTPKTASHYSWRSIVYAKEIGNGMLVAVGDNATVGVVMTSTDNGETWVDQTIPAIPTLRSVAWSGSMLVAVGGNATGDNCISSPDGVNWTVRTLAQARWQTVSYSPFLSLFIALSDLGAYAARSSDGVTWAGTDLSAVGLALNFLCSCWSEALRRFVAFSDDTNPYATITSDDGITWTGRAAPLFARAVTWSPYLGLYVAVGTSGTNTQQAMTSPDGETWTIQVTPNSAAHDWHGICWSEEKLLFVAVGNPANGGSNEVMTSTDALTWGLETTPSNSRWDAVCAADPIGLFVAVSTSTGTDAVMVSAG